MATRIETKPSDLYERDIYAWSKEQAALLRARRFGDLDLEHLTQEVEDVGESLYREVRSRVRTIIEHLLKLERSPATEPRAGWEKTIRTQRADLADDLTPSLRPRIEANLPRFYEIARIEAATTLREHGESAAADALPATCPYTPSSRSPATGCREGAGRNVLACQAMRPEERGDGDADQAARWQAL